MFYFASVHLPNEWAPHSSQGPDLPRTGRQQLPMTQPFRQYIPLLALPRLPDHTVMCSGLDVLQIYTARPGQWIVCIASAQMCWFSNSSRMPPDVHTFSPTPIRVPPPEKPHTESLLIESKLSLKKKEDICIWCCFIITIRQMRFSSKLEINLGEFMPALGQT